MRRREFLTLLGGAAGWPLTASAQQLRKSVRIGYLAASNRVPWIDGLVDGLRDLGYVEGKNLIIEWRLAAGQLQLVPAMAAELVSLNVDVIVAASSFVVSEAKKATTTIPIVGVATHDGVGIGLYSTLANPGANVTGVESLAPELDVKRVGLLKQIAPTVSRLNILYNPLSPGARIHIETLTATTQRLAIEARPIELRSSAEFDTAANAMLQYRPHALLSVADPLILFERQRIVDFGIEHGIPNAHEIREFVQLGALFSYGAPFYGIWHRAAYYVDRILRGTKPVDLPVELPTVFDFAVNLKAAKALGLAIPETLLGTADSVIE